MLLPIAHSATKHRSLCYFRPGVEFVIFLCNQISMDQNKSAWIQSNKTCHIIFTLLSKNMNEAKEFIFYIVFFSCWSQKTIIQTKFKEHNHYLEIGKIIDNFFLIWLSLSRVFCFIWFTSRSLTSPR